LECNASALGAIPIGDLCRAFGWYRYPDKFQPDLSGFGNLTGL